MFEDFGKERLAVALDGFKKEVAIFGIVMMAFVLYSVFDRDSAVNLFYEGCYLLPFLMAWFYCDENVSKSKVLYGLAWGVSLVFLLVLLLLESELGVTLFSFRDMLPLFISLVALLGVTLAKGNRVVRFSLLGCSLLLLFYMG